MKQRLLLVQRIKELRVCNKLNSAQGSSFIQQPVQMPLEMLGDTWGLEDEQSMYQICRPPHC